jgi:hypothetical protein
MKRIHNTSELTQDLSEATDYELAIAYYWADEDDAKYPLYLIKEEMDYRDLTFNDLEGMLFDY